MSLVSIIIPYYKKKDTVKDSVCSVLKQSYQNFELIIVYDDINHSDITLISNIQKLDKRIKVLINKTNLGSGLSRNEGINISKGKYLAFLDADDVWDYRKLEKQINFMEINNYAATHTSYHIVDSNNNVRSTRVAKKLDFKTLLKSCDIGLSTVVIRKDILKSNLKFPKIATKEDYVLWLLITKNGNVFYPLHDILTQWKISKNSLSSNVLRKLIDGYTVYYKYMKFSLSKSFLLLLQLCIFYLWKNSKF
jgi:teichuronic acid biosynthesis glycosyltransferase TuaG